MKQNLLYEGKAKKIFSTDKNNILLMEFKDSLTAFNALKKGQFEGKGQINCKISKFIFDILSENKIKHHFIDLLDDKNMLVKKTTIIPLEVVVRNVVAGSLAKKLGKNEGEILPQSLVEFYYKDDALGDPFVSEEQILVFGWATQEQIVHLKNQAKHINEVLKMMFLKAGIKLVDIKIEFGLDENQQIILADEISPDCMRLWDIETNKKLDKDRFRQDLGDVDAAYFEVYKRLQQTKETV